MAGHYQLGEGLAMMRPVYVAETQEQAEKDCKEGYNLLGQWGSHGLYKDWTPDGYRRRAGAR